MAGLSLMLAKDCGIHPQLVERIARTAPSRYKDFYIPKRSGGVRLISQPAREVKLLQVSLLNVLLRNLPIHPAATAYEPGRRLVDNVLPHVKSGPILKLDLKDFFPSITKTDWVNYCRRRALLDDDDVELASQILFRKRGRKLRLSIGAPSSPTLSNALLFEFDELIVEAVLSTSRGHVVYTRYADDMTFSAPRTGHLNGVIPAVYKVIRSLDSPSLWVNRDKTTTVTKKYRRVVTGIVISNDKRPSLGRRRKRFLHAATHRASLNLLDPRSTQQLAGWLAFAGSVEPDFLVTLSRRYGSDTIQRIRKAVVRGSRKDADHLLEHLPALSRTGT